MQSRQVSHLSILNLMLVRLANRLKSLTMTNYSSDEDAFAEDADHFKSRPAVVKKSSGGAAFAQVVRAAQIKAKEDEEETTAASKTV
jgi:hypothetical protein